MMNMKRGVKAALAVGAVALMAGGLAPPAAAAASSSTTVTSNGFATTPLVVGLKLAAAEYRVTDAGLDWSVRYIDNDCTVNRVAFQDPGAGTVLPLGSTVTLWVHPICNGPQQ
jgi:beta-lactam-binding protein with PASTA domain